MNESDREGENVIGLGGTPINLRLLFVSFYY